MLASGRAHVAASVLFAALVVACGDSGSGATGGGQAPGGGDTGGGGHGGASAGGGGQAPTGPKLEVPPFASAAYVVAGQGGSNGTLTVKNVGDARAAGTGHGALAWSIDGDATLSFTGAPTAIEPGASASVAIHFDGAAAETIARATLHLASNAGAYDIAIYGVAGDPGLGPSTWADLDGPGGVRFGEGTTVSMPAAPFPDGSGSWSDPSVHVFVPEHHRDRGAQDLVVHFHGFNATIAETLPAHLYREQVYASGANAVLVVPQGPVDAASGDFGKLMNPGGLSALTREVLVTLFRDGRIGAPALDELRLTSHSGGYDAVATNLMTTAMAPPIAGVDLFDSVYGFVSTFEQFAVGGGLLRSNYTCCGGTDANNQQMLADLVAMGVDARDTATQTALLGARAVVSYADSSHDGSTRVDGLYGEDLRFGMHHSRRGPRIELRSVVAANGSAHVTWLAPADDDTKRLLVQTSADGATWKTAAMAPASAHDAHFPLSGGARVRVLPDVAGVADPLPSDVYRVDAGADVLVVDGFDRVVDGGFGGLSHDFAATVGEAAGKVHTIAHRALTEDAFSLSGYATVVWVLGDESVADHALSDAEQQAITAYLASGGHLVVSGSELGYTLAQSSAGSTFLADTFGASFSADASGSYTSAGAGPLAAIASFAYSSAGGPYAVQYPDAFDPTGAGETVLVYGNGMGAAVGVAGQAVLVGFPLELVDDPAARKKVVRALVQFAGG